MKILRIALALLNLLALCAIFAVPGGFHARLLAPLVKIQFLPAVLSLNIIVIIALIALTLLFGRAYCRIICPLGISQDLMRGFMAPRRVCTRLPESRAQSIVRWCFLLATIALGVCGLHFVWLDPYAIFSRALVLAHPFAFDLVHVLAVVPFALILVLSIIGFNRIWCNWVCPVGTVLALLARFAWRKDKMTDSACKHCRKCINK